MCNRLKNKPAYCSTFEYILYTLTKTYLYDECLVLAFDDSYDVSFESSYEVRLSSKKNNSSVVLPLTEFYKNLIDLIDGKENLEKIDHLEEHEYNFEFFDTLCSGR